MQHRPPYFLSAGLLYLGFVVYGSLVPLDFHALPMAEAVSRFRQIPYLNLGIGSLADWVANLLLFIPLSFIWLGLAWQRFNLRAQLIMSALVVALSVALALSIEFTQVFFPPRTVSLNDIIAESLGSVLGVLAWWLVGEKFCHWLEQWSLSQGNASVSTRLLQAYLAFLFFYNVMPLDLTISPVELYHKWNAGKVILLPFGAYFLDIYQQSYNLAVDTLIWSPVAFLLVYSKTKQPYPAIAWSVTYAAVIELLQLFVYSRVTDVSDIILAVPGSAFGAWAAARLEGGSAGLFKPNSLAYSKVYPLSAIAFLSWCVVLAAVFWYPFNFTKQGSELRQHFDAMHWVPFYSYYYGSEFRALTEVFHKTLFFVPLGAICRIFVAAIGHSAYARLAEFGAFLLIALVAFGVEAGQLFLPGKNADVTDFMLEIMGGLIGYYGLRKIQAKTAVGQVLLKNRLPPSQAPAAAGHPRRVDFAFRVHGRQTWLPLLAGIILLAVAAGFALQSPAMPYNVRELLNPSYPALAALMFSCCVFWILGFPVVISHWLFTPAAKVQFYPLMLILHGMVAYIMVSIFSTGESMDDIVGSPILGWPWHWEQAGRFLALFSAVSLPLTAATFLVLALVYKSSAARGFAALVANWVVLFPMLYWIVVVEAATDNLTELMAGGGSLGAAVLLSAFLALLFASGAWLATRVRLGLGSRSWTGCAGIALGYPLAYLLISYGTEDFIEKYGKVFSALQFLLSSDRSNYLQGWDLLKRYLFLHSGVLVTVMLVQYSAIATLLFVPRGHPPPSQDKPGHPGPPDTPKAPARRGSFVKPPLKTR